MIINSVKCTGCALCSNVCPVKAIEMRKNEEGFLYPIIDPEKCTECKLCDESCPEIEKRKGICDAKIYSAYNHDLNARMHSASGGIFSAVATGILKQKGCVCGVAYDESFDCMPVFIDNEAELGRLRGTKYFQCDIQSVYGEIIKRLKRHPKVLFCGTPCQVRAVKKYAEKLHCTDGLYTMDLLCRGITSYKVFEGYLQELEHRIGSRITSIQVKEKEHGWNRVGTQVTFSNGGTLYEDGEKSIFIEAFLKENHIRKSCFECQYRSLLREGDLTTGDFWGLKDNCLSDNFGTSLIMVNTDKGQRMLDDAGEVLVKCRSTMWRAKNRNLPAFTRCNIVENNRELFFSVLRKDGLAEALKRSKCIERTIL